MKGKPIRLTMILLAIILSYSCQPDPAGNPPEPGLNEESSQPYQYTGSPAYKILFIGSSYFAYNKFTTLFREMALAAKKEISIDSRIIPGTYLDYHAVNDLTLSKIREDKWDYVVLQGVGTNMAYPETANHPVLPALLKLSAEIRNNHADSHLVYCMPWAFEDGMLWTAEGTDDYFAMQQKIYHNTLKYSKTVDFIIAPVGWAWYRILEKITTPHYLHTDDYNHPSYRGSFLMACVIFCTIYRENIVNLPYHGLCKREEARKFQEVASAVVLDNPELWNIPENPVSRQQSR